MYSQVFNLHSELLKAMSHPKRLEIIHLLRDQEMDVTTICEMLDMPQSNVSQHLQILRSAGVVDARRNGKGMYYKLSHRNYIKASDLVREILIEKHKNDPLSDELTKKMKDLVPLTSDPVCGMRLSPVTAAFAKKYHNNDYYFCASGCFEKFNKNPGKYISK